MDTTYHSVYIRYERTGDTIKPVAVRKEWVGTGVNRKFTIVRVTGVRWGKIPADLNTWSSIDKLNPINRAQLMQQGLVKEAGYNWPNGCFMIEPDWYVHSRTEKGTIVYHKGSVAYSDSPDFSDVA